MQKSTKIKIVIGVASFLLVILMVVGFFMGSFQPSPADVEKAVLINLQSNDDYQWVQEVEVVQYIESFRERRITGLLWWGPVLWSVKVCLIGDQQREERVVHLCSFFGRWEVSRWAIPTPP